MIFKKEKMTFNKKKMRSFRKKILFKTKDDLKGRIVL